MSDNIINKILNKIPGYTARGKDRNNSDAWQVINRGLGYQPTIPPMSGCKPPITGSPVHKTNSDIIMGVKCDSAPIDYKMVTENIEAGIIKTGEHCKLYFIDMTTGKIITQI